MEAKSSKRMRFNNGNSNCNEKLELKIWQNLQLSKCYDDNYINKLLESTRKFLVASEELTIENEAISTAINTFGLKKSSLDMFSDSDDSNLPSTSQSPRPTVSTSRQHTSSTSTTPDTLESDAINSAISSYGLHNNY